MFDRIKSALGFGPRLNCKAGDICMVRHFDHAGDIEVHVIGRVVRVVSLTWPPEKKVRPFWTLEEPLLVNTLGAEWRIGAISDAVLRPLDNPSDDAQDEMIRIVGPAPAVAVREAIKA